MHTTYLNYQITFFRFYCHSLWIYASIDLQAFIIFTFFNYLLNSIIFFPSLNKNVVILNNFLNFATFHSFFLVLYPKKFLQRESEMGQNICISRLRQNAWLNIYIQLRASVNKSQNKVTDWFLLCWQPWCRKFNVSRNLKCMYVECQIKTWLNVIF